MPRVIPQMRPRASGRHCGEPSPVRAGTKWTPPVDSTLVGERARSPPPTRSRRARREATASPRRPRAPSPRRRTRAARPERPRQPSSTGRRRAGPRRSPRLTSTNVPVPYVAFASPGAKQPWPKRAACWSPAIPATGSVTPRNDASAARPGRGDDLGEHGAIDPEQGEQLVVPLARREIEQHRPRRVRHVGDVRRPARQLPHEPRVDRPERELRLRLLDPRQDPLELRRREVRVGDEPGSLADQRGRQLRAALGGAPVLPDDRGMHRRAGTPLPDDGRLALVRDPDRRRARERPHQRRRAPRPRSARRSPRSPPGRARPSRARGKCCRISRYPRPSTRSSGSTTRHVVPVVPWSIARITG